MAIAGSLVTTASAKTDQFEAGMRRMRQHLAQTTQSSRETSQSMEALGRSVASVTASVVSFAALTAAITSSVQAAIQLQAVTAAFTAIEGSAKAAQETLAFVASEAQRLGLDAATLVESFKGIDAAARGTSLAGKDVRDIFTSISEASRVLGLSSEQTQGALTAIGQSISKGAIQAEELRGQLAERLPGAFQIMARAVGLSTEQLSKALDDGAFKGEVAAEAWRRFAVQLQTEYAPGVAAAASSTSAEFARLGNATTGLQQSFGLGLLPALGETASAFGSFLASAHETARTLGQALDPVVRAVGVSVLILANATQQAGKGLAALTLLATEGSAAFKFALADMAKTSEEVNALIARLNAGPAAVVAATSAPAAPLLTQAPLIPAPVAAVKAPRVRQARSGLTAGQRAEVAEVKAAARELEQADERRRRDLTAQVELEQGVIDALQRQVDTVRLTTDELARQDLIEQVADETLRAKGESLLTILQIQRELVEAFREEQDVQDQLARDREDEAKAFADIKEKADKAIVDAEKDTARELRRQTKDVADFFTDTILSATDIGKRGFKDFADSAIADLQRLLVKQFVAPQLSKLLDQGIGLAVSLFGAGAGIAGGASAGASGLDTFLAGIGSFGGAEAAGGPVMPGKFYLVGEQGPELFAPGQSGAILPNGAGMTQQIVVNIATPDAGSFLRSQGQVRRALAQAAQSAARDS